MFKLIFPHSFFYYLLSSLLLGSTSNLMAQTKFEKEYRIKSTIVPTKALAFINACPFSSKIKWYREVGLINESIEAKLKHQKIRYSIEFDTSGQIEDVESDIKFTALPLTTQKNIKAHLDQTFDRYKFIKTQTQWIGSNATLLQLINYNKVTEAYTLNYEIVLKGKTKKETHLYEFLFSQDGHFKQQSTIILRNTDNLDY